MNVPSAAIFLPSLQPNAPEKKEGNLVKHLLQTPEQQARLAVDQLSAVRPDHLPKLLKNLARRKRVLLLHCAPGFPLETLSALAAPQSELKFVFFSGSLRDTYQNQLAKLNLPAWIVLREGPEEARLGFVRKFYENLAAGVKLGEAFEQARLYASMQHGMKIHKAQVMPKPQEQRGYESGLYWQQDAVLDWTLPTQPLFPHPPAEDRQAWVRHQAIKDRYLQLWGAQKDQFLLFPVEDQALGIKRAKRLLQEEFALAYEKPSLSILKVDMRGPLPEIKLRFCERLLGVFGLPPTHLTPGKAKKHILSSTLAKDKDAIFVVLKVYQSEWKPHGRHLLQWVYDLLGSPERLPGLHPDLHFLVWLVMDQYEGKNLSFSFAPNMLKSLKRIQGIEICKVFA